MAFHGWRIGTIVLATSMALAACSGEEETAAAQAPVTGEQPVQPPAPPAPPPAVTGDNSAPAPNTAPVVSGTPAAALSAGQAWSFTPSATDADGDALTWSIAGKPADATFSTATGQLSWTPGATGTWNDIVVTATDSRGAATSLPPFSLLVSGAQQVAATATLSWDMPQQYVDGAPLLPEDQVVGYRVYHGTSEATMDVIAPVNDPSTLNYTVETLTAGTHYFAVSAVSVTGAEGERSPVLVKTVM